MRSPVTGLQAAVSHQSRDLELNSERLQEKYYRWSHFALAGFELTM